MPSLWAWSEQSYEDYGHYVELSIFEPTCKPDTPVWYLNKLGLGLNEFGLEMGQPV